MNPGISALSFVLLQAVFRRAGGLIYVFLLLSCGIRLLMFQPCFDRILICLIRSLIYYNYNITKLPLKLSNLYKQVLLAWHLIYKHNFSPHSYFIWNNGVILYKSKSLFFPNWVNNNIILVSQLLNSDGYLYSYSEFLNKYNIPVTPREFAIVMDAIPCGAITLLKGSTSSQSSFLKIHPFDTMIGKLCFLSPSCGRNKIIRQLFQAEITSLPYIVSHWNGLYDNIPWKKVWTLSSKYLITNKVKEVSYKLLHLFYPVKLYMKNVSRY